MSASAGIAARFAAGGAFVLGGGGGLGAAICHAFAGAGVPVALSYRHNRAAAEASVAAVRAIGVEAHMFAVDARDRAAVATALREAAALTGGLHSVVYAAGPPVAPAFFGQITDQTWRDWLDGDVLAAIHLAQESIPHLRASAGAFLALSSYQANMVEVRGGMSAIAKGAVDRMVAVMAKEEGRYGVRANSLRCGWIASATNDRLFREMPEVAASKKKSIPLGRLGDPLEIGETVLFLCSHAAGFITGQALTADGGESL